MKRLKSLVIISSSILLLSPVVASAEMVNIFGPLYVSKTKADHEKEVKVTFRAPVPGKGVIIVKNGGDSGKEARVGAARVELNDQKVFREKDFNKTVDVLKYDVELLPENRMEVEVKSCKECEISITVMGEAALPPRTPLPTR